MILNVIAPGIGIAGYTIESVIYSGYGSAGIGYGQKVAVGIVAVGYGSVRVGLANQPSGIIIDILTGRGEGCPGA
ncbi:MAG: hypothetical protein VB084_14840 [Syntrophomonadaceae bacterium]|nr:hypothetical protein [Syntrophomonadaceae bacterium]